MWQRFTGRAREAVYAAKAAAEAKGTPLVSTEHLLLGILMDESSAGFRVLASLGIEADRLKKEVERLIPCEEPREPAEPTLAQEAKRAIDFAYDEAREFKDNYIGTEHLLLGLIRQKKGIAGRACAALGIQLENARLAVVALQMVDGKRSAPKTESKTDIWDRFDETAREAIFAANKEAQRLGQPTMSPDHFLTGLLADPKSGAVRALERLNVDVDALRLANLQMGRSEGPPHTKGTGYSPASNAAFLLAYEERRAMNMPRVGPEHLLIGLLREPDGTAGRILSQFGVELDALRVAAILPNDETESE